MKTREPAFPDEIQFTVYGDAIPKQRARVVRTKTKDGSPGKSHAFTPKETVEWEASVYGQSLAKRPHRPFEGPVSLGVVFYKKIPRTWSKAKKAACEAGEIRPQGKRDDYDNLIKAVKDALRGIYFMDDGDVVEYIPIDGVNPGKYYSHTPRVEILVRFNK